MAVDRSGLFASVPARDYLLFWQAGRFQPQRVARFLGLSNSEVASLSGVAPSSVRFDAKIPRGLRDRLSEVAATCTLVAEVFGGDATRTALWFKTRNSTLGDVSPRHMIVSGRHDELRRNVMEAVGETPRTASSKSEGSSTDRYLGAHRGAITELCKRYGVRSLAAFGSVLRAEFDPARSDIDFAVEFASDSAVSPARQYFDFKTALERLLSRPVDLVELSAMPESRLKRIIERTKVPVYGQAA